MEFVSVGVIALIIGVVWYIGLFDSGMVVADMATREVSELERDQKVRMINNAAKRKIDKTTYDKAVAANKDIDAFDI